MLKEVIEKIDSNVTVFHDFESVSVEMDTLRNALSLLKQLEALGEIDELLEDLALWHEFNVKDCEGCHTCQESIPRLRKALDIREASY
ncbi:hypothetical protein YDYSY3_38240 [Paenibacillus chitinolyticus]|uniref:hypothetical protein n=1 Tax=Paenibacillus chitinolyticus TaxID=79263 RepID=UPI0026E4AA05|nr:hypothetical protein [Paenibacillus chitinolyticus]GKS12824.1 hypothetical protein YDYSY3_38240 [Paenibacillus chitinolyticus]